MAKRLLIIKASTDVCAAELDQLQAIAGMLNIEHDSVEIADYPALYEEIEYNEKFKDGQKFDFVYLAAHANTEVFGESDGSVAIGWGELATFFCAHERLNPGAILLLGCCRGGLKKVALQLFSVCEQIDYVCGPRWTVTPADITAGFHCFIYNMGKRFAWGQSCPSAFTCSRKRFAWSQTCFSVLTLLDCGDTISLRRSKCLDVLGCNQNLSFIPGGGASGLVVGEGTFLTTK